MTERPVLYVVDTVMIDVVSRIDALPERGGDVPVRERLVETGGGFNVMSAAARQGVDVIYAGQLGEGAFSSIALQSLLDEGVQHPISQHGRDIGVCFVLVEKDGERTFITSPGAELDVTVEELSQLKVRDGDVVYFSGYDFVYPELCGVTLEWLRALPPQALVAFDPAPRILDVVDDVAHEVLARTDWLLCNEREARELSGYESPSEAARELATRLRGNVVVRTGADGCTLYVDGVSNDVDGFETTVVDTNGAGDSFNGIFLAELLGGHSVLEAARRANAGAALAISRLGPATTPRAEEITRFLARG
jgi:sugar/nucleoside kinase (ribokinase family)